MVWNIFLSFCGNEINSHTPICSSPINGLQLLPPSALGNECLLHDIRDLITTVPAW